MTGAKSIIVLILAAVTGASLPATQSFVFAQAAATPAGTPDDGHAQAIWWVMGVFAVLFCGTILAAGRLVTDKLSKMDEKLNDIRVDFAEIRTEMKSLPCNKPPTCPSEQQ